VKSSSRGPSRAADFVECREALVLLGRPYLAEIQGPAAVPSELKSISAGTNGFAVD
jgi:hypothetical protein